RTRPAGRVRPGVTGRAPPVRGDRTRPPVRAPVAATRRGRPGVARRGDRPGLRPPHPGGLWPGDRAGAAPLWIVHDGRTSAPTVRRRDAGTPVRPARE